MRNLTALLLTGIVLCCSCFVDGTAARSPGSHGLPRQENAVEIKMVKNGVVLDNKLVQITFSNPGGDVIAISYGGIDNLLEINNVEGDRGYWDVVWDNVAETVHTQNKLPGTQFKVITQSPDQVEISFITTYNANLHRGDNGVTVPVNIDKRYILQRGRTGFYTYAIFERLQGWPGGRMETLRVAFKLQGAKFRYMAVSDTRQRFMPTAQDRARGKPLAYKEAVLLNNETSSPEFAGEVDDKYQYSAEDKDIKVHGWISMAPPVGFWMITPSDESRMAGPFKQDLTSHVGPTSMTVFSCSHYVGRDVGLTFREGEAWKKLFGPVYVYLNSAPPSSDSRSLIRTLWNNAKDQMVQEVKSWPYNFISSQDYPPSNQRGSVSGQLLVNDRYIPGIWVASSAYVGLAAPGEVGSWQKESKGYQFWTQTDAKGNFFIEHVRPGHYNLYASVPGIVGDYKYEVDIIIKPGSKIQLGSITYQPPRIGPTLWEIGIPDRSAAEFYIPEPYPTLTNKLYKGSELDKFRQYGLWARYNELYPKNDLIYKVGASNYRHDWFYAQVCRFVGNNKYVGTTWQIQFELNAVNPGIYTLQLALASATYAELEVRVNNANAKPPLFSTGLIGDDNAIARHGIHGLYWFWSIKIPSTSLHKGSNTIYLTQTRGGTPLQGVMYDYIRLEGPAEKP
ncbi:PREDICTED: probable rhamnogalacturonate lyase B [Fragaria vesca subsp. vesca]|uniref:probable rhamnogalacturonate lyase B n=1 Tax=Fragaria vesca subsp. vesca TaxID=101020 RepID=UPI0002C2E796|nr:PREDICTED: probable rhamnogalacturonate lyase B [Fragaria vesca subsp. vesca]